VGGGGRGWERVFSPYLSEGNFQSKLVSQHKQGEWGGGNMRGGGRQMVDEVKTTDMGMGKGKREKEGEGEKALPEKNNGGKTVLLPIGE
jgi:hypothetical protein